MASHPNGQKPWMLFAEVTKQSELMNITQPASWWVFPQNSCCRPPPTWLKSSVYNKSGAGTRWPTDDRRSLSFVQESTGSGVVFSILFCKLTSEDASIYDRPDWFYSALIPPTLPPTHTQKEKQMFSSPANTASGSPEWEVRKGVGLHMPHIQHGLFFIFELVNLDFFFFFLLIWEFTELRLRLVLTTWT